MESKKVWTKTSEPTSYTQIYNYVENILDECSKTIDDLEVDYYQGVSASLNLFSNNFTMRRPLNVTALVAWSRPLNELRNARSSHDFRNGKHIRDTLNDAKMGTLIGPVSDESLFLIKRILDKTNEQLYSKIPNLATKLNDCLNLMEQYFLSFFEIENIQDTIQKKKKENAPDEYLDTPYKYEKARCLHMFQVNKSIKLLREMQQRVEDTRGVILSTLSKETQELALRCDCTSLSYVFALPECYIEARRAIIAMRIWLQDDSRYTPFVQGSLRILDEKYNEVKKTFEISKAHLSHAEHRANSYKLQLSKAEKENEVNEKKLAELEDRFNQKEREYLSKRLTFEVYEEQLKKMLQAAEDVNDGVDHHISIERFQREIKEFSKELPKLKSQIDSIQVRIDFFQKCKDELKNMEAEHNKRERDVQLATEENILKENEFIRLVKCRDQIRQIYRCRSTNDLPRKIFYSLPVKAKHIGDDKDELDDFSKVINLTARYIGRDWSRLYWKLPFYPSRGQQEVSRDINHIDDKYHRGNVFHDQALDALNKWRRFHTRAKIADLIQSLRDIHRLDIIQLINQRILKPKQPLTDEKEEIDERKQEIENLNRKLNRLFEKIRTGVIATHDTYVYSTIGLDPLEPVRKHRPLVMQ